ncbi:MAG: hypothetical protein MI975_00435 [Cytophagales bacterium]|nr:hypothetical protein [Cytophagales bacterium]
MAQKSKKKDDSGPSKLRKLLEKLKLFEKKLKSKEKNIDKEIKKGKLKRASKGDLRSLKEKKETLAKKSKKVTKEINKAEEELKKADKRGKSKDQKKKKSGKSKIKKKHATDLGLLSGVSRELEDMKSPATLMPISTDLKVRDAITYLRNLPAVAEVESFVKDEKRLTVQKAAASRLNALRRKKNP